MAFQSSASKLYANIWNNYSIELLMVLMVAMQRVMPRYFFCLLRLWIRVDDVLFRIVDTRFYHEYGTNEIIREWSSKEAPWEKVEQVCTLITI